MADTNETIADIIAEMRGMGNYQRYSGDHARVLAGRIEAAHKRERGEMLDALVRIGNWCAQDLAENAFIGDASGNYEKTLHGLCEVCRPFMQKASKLKRYGGANG